MANRKKKPTFSRGKRFLLDAIIIAIAIMVVLSGIAFTSLINDTARKSRITEIFNSLRLDPQNYNQTGELVFGDKRLFSWDSSRSYASYRTYVRASDVKSTVDDLKNAVLSAGFFFYDNPYPNSTVTELIYKSQKDEYLKLVVSSKARDDAWFNAAMMGKSTDDIVISPNDGPSSIRIYVNLDDNNY